jgi:hypothetical protein
MAKGVDQAVDVLSKVESLKLSKEPVHKLGFLGNY